MILVINKETREERGECVSVDNIDDLSAKFMFEPFVRNFGFIVYKDKEGKYGVADPKTHVLVEVIEE